ncbi:MAG: SDR family NAD(P)-dependent oxidoreductase, partial [Myxococcota bacterium]|nr:SDR family NAD(P)-dependent oxidoreductase [Myxococcota bacterium]
AEYVDIVSCDVTDRASLGAVLESIPPAYPLAGVYHLAGVLDDGVLTALTDEQLTKVFAPKVDGAWNLHELTQAYDLDAFVLFSSVAGAMGGPGQGNYAAANTFVDALAAARRKAGLAGMSLAWGFWEQAGVGMTAHLGSAELARLSRQGLVAMSAEEGLGLMDEALSRSETTLLPVRFDLGRLQRMAGDASAIPPLWREMFKPRLRRASSGSQDASALRQRLSMLPEAERGDVLTEMVRAEIATVLGLAGANAIPADQPLKDLGLDSLMAVELRNRLAAMAQINIPATLAFDYPTPEAISGFMLQKAFSDLGAGVEAVASTQVIGDDETIAVVGMSCRLPGGVSDPESYWELLADGRDAISGFPERWQNADLFDPDPDAIGKTYCQEGGFLDQIDLFDASFFGIAPREAVSMDPQQRLLLEVSWEALERAGIKPFDLRGSLTGVYIGSIGSDYQLPNEDFDVLDGYQATGRAASVLSGRLSYTLGLQGPALTIDTACSSSLISLHLACNALRHGECHLALAGGSQTMVTPAIFVEMSRLRAQSVDGRCKSFSSRADGASWSEGVGMLVLKRLSDAERDGDRVLAVIKGTAVNQDGRSQGLTAPNGPSQQRVIRQALAGCGLKPNDIDLIEAHGTGTSLGDPIEAGALAEVFGPTRSEVEPLVLGSSKSNIGHAQAAAGVAGVMKVILSLMHETIPKTLHAEEPTPHIPWEESRIELAQSARGWPRRDDRVRRAGVSAFGISGTNAHVIIEEAPSREPELVLGATLQAPLPLMISGRDLDALRGQAARMKAWLEADETIELPQVAYAAACERTHFQSRALISVQDREQALDALGALADGGAHAALTNGVAQPRGEVVFVFPGQGSQWQAMGKSLLDESSVFAETIDACDAVLSPLTGWSVRTVLAGDEGQQTPSLDRVDVVQPALFAMSVGLGALWRSLGLEPKAVVGHSQGEVGAAVVAGALSLEDAARVVVVRSTLVRKIAGRGGMLLVEQPVEAVEERLSRYEGALSIAVVNTATSTVVSGDNDALEALLSELQAEDVFARKVNVDYASHSIHVDTILTELTEQLADIRPQPVEIPFYSTVTGGKLDGSALDANYWGRNLREPVRLDRALQGLLADDFGVFVEVSAHPLLGMPLTSACSDSGGVVIGTLQRDQGGLAQVYSALGALHTHGHAIDWEALLVGQRSQGLVLPTYAFQRSRYWLEATGLLADVTSAGMTSAEHPLLGATTALADSDGYLFTGRLSRREQPWLADHGVFGTTLFPGTGLLELALAATRQLGGATVSELALAAPVVLPAGEALRIQLSLEPADATGQRTLMLHSQPEEASEEMGWTHHATGVVQTEQEPTGVRCDDLVSWPPPEAEALELDGFYEELRERGFDYGPSFQGLQEAWRTPRAAYGRVSLPERLTTSANAYGLHPALLDAALHTLMAAGRDQEQTDGDGVLLPFEWADVSLFAVGATELRVRVELEYTGADATSAKLVIADGGGQLVATVGALRVRRATMQQIAAATRTDVRHLYRVDWQPALLPKEERPTSEFMVVGGQGQLAELLGVRHVPSLEDWLASRDEDETAPSCFLVDDTASRDHSELLEHLHTVTSQSLSLLQQWLGAEGLGESELIWVTRGAVSVSPDDAMDDLAHAPTWGLLRSARSENPDRIMRILDLGPEAPSRATILRAFNLSDEPEAAIRYGKLLAARLGVAAVGSVEPPEHGPWKLELPERGRLDRLVAEPLGAEELEAGQIRIAMRAAGINFRDVLNVLGMVPVPWLGLELAGVVSELGPEVEGLSLGDRVWGMGRASFASHSVADARLVAKVPEGLSFEEAATMPLTYLTAFYALVDLGELKPGERVLIHAGAGGVGMAAIQLAQLIGAEVFATASEPKWDVLRAMGISDDHIASSRSLGFGAAFTAVTEGAGVDVVLNSLAREFVDESLDLLGEGGRFLEMGKTDLRDAAQLASTHPGLRYLPLDLSEAGVEALSGMLNKLGDYFERGELKPLTFSAYDLRDAGSAFRFMANARHVGKLVLTMPREREPQGTALLTGGTGELGQAVARHLVLHHHVRSLILTSRRGMESTGAAELVEELRELGASRVEIVACDVTDLAAVQAVVNSCPPEHPLTAVFHLAGVLDDAVLGNLTQAMLERVLAPKVDGAWNLHRATESCQLAQFVLFSSAAGTLGGPGQGNYAAANTFLDMLAARRRKLGLAGLSLAWGFWEQAGVGMTAHLGTAELARMSRQGIVAMSVEEGLALLDASMRRPETALVPVRFDLKKMQRGVAQLPAIPAMWRNLLRQGLRKASGTSEEASQLRVRLAGLSEQGRIEALGELVRGEVAAVLGLAGAEAVPGEEPLKDLGLDSLMAVELRNRLAMQTDVTLPATVAFDYPTPNAIGEYLYKKAFEDLNRASGMTATRIQRDPDEPIAIIGMACRLPGEVEDPESYWELLRDGRDAIQDFGHRWPAELLYDPDPDAVGMTYSRHGGFMKQIDLFDAGFFGISPREASSMGPDQRILLETSWEALERAGLRPSALKDSLTGVYIGSVGSDYGQRNESFDILDGYQGTGRAGSVLSGRISYALGLQGPAMTLDTACSSSLVSMHLASTALRQGECDLALAGGVQVMVTPSIFIEMSRLRAQSPDGRCKSFSDDATGAAWAEGVGVLVLKRLSDAQRDGDRVLALIRSSAVNQDGRSNGLTAPNGPSQQRVIQQALANGGLSPNDIDYLEAHGTGTTLGDPIEAGALAEVFGPTRQSDRPLYLGSSKSNLGHSQASAGVAGVIKVILSMHAQMLPKTLHAETPSSHIAWEGSGLSLLREPQGWEKQSGRVRRAGVSGFGISGTNAHVIIEEAPTVPGEEHEINLEEAYGTGREPMPLLLSGRDDGALRDQALNWARWLEDNPSTPFFHVLHTAAVRRTHFTHRLGVMARNATEAAAGLRAFVEEGRPASIVHAEARGRAKVAYVFPGQGSQWLGMGRALLETSEIFTEVIAECDDLMTPLIDWSLLAVLRGDEGAASIERTDVLQPAHFAVTLGLAALWRSFGILPQAVVGHSQGEVGAAVVAGVLSLEDGVRLIVERSKLIRRIAGQGAMAAVSMDAPALEERLARFGGQLGIAVRNTQRSLVFSGPGEFVDELVAELQAEDIFCRRSNADYAAHSIQMDALLGELTESLREIEPRAGSVPLYSSVLGERIDGSEMDSRYWCRNLRDTV